MVTVTRFAEAVLPHGTTTAFIDNHEMANVFGLEGMRWMLEEGRDLPLKVFLAVPSCVPALPGFEDAGAALGPAEIREALGWEGVGRARRDDEHARRDRGQRAARTPRSPRRSSAGKPVTGHWSLAGWNDHRLQAYIAAGVDSCHETSHREDALAKLRAGMWVQFREGSDLARCGRARARADRGRRRPRHCLLVTDDILPETLLDDGHMDHVVRRAIEEGLDPLLAIQMATVNARRVLRPAPRPRLDRPRPARRHPLRRGPARLSAAPRDRRRPRDAGGASALEPPAARSANRPARAPAHRGGPADRRPRATRARVRAIGMVPGELATEHRVVEVPVDDGAVPAGRARPRQGGEHRAPRRPGTIGLGFVQGLGLQRGAVATTGRARQPQPPRRRDERRGHARRGRAARRGRGRHGRGRGRRDARRSSSCRSPA